MTETPSGAEETAFYADNIKYGGIRGAELFGATIECYTYPPEWEECDGSTQIAPGVSAFQQTRKSFGMSYRTLIGNDTDGVDHGYKLHLLYGGTASPSERAYATINESPEAITFSYEVTTTPVPVTGYRPTSVIVIDSTLADATKLAALEAILYGDADVDARLPLPDEVATLMAADTP